MPCSPLLQCVYVCLAAQYFSLLVCALQYSTSVYFITVFQSISKFLVGGIAPNEVIARSEFEVHREMFTE